MPPWRDNTDRATNEKCWHHFRILVVDKWSVVCNECKNREFLFRSWKSLWSLATWLVISDRYISEVILQLFVEAMASHSNKTKPMPQLRTEYILLIPSSTIHYVCVLSGAVYINDNWFIHRIPVSFSGACAYNILSRIMVLCCCTHSSLIQCNQSYMIPE